MKVPEERIRIRMWDCWLGDRWCLLDEGRGICVLGGWARCGITFKEVEIILLEH